MTSSIRPHLLGLSAFPIAIFIDIFLAVAISFLAIFNMDGIRPTLTSIQLFLEFILIFASYPLALLIVSTISKWMKFAKEDHKKVLWTAILALVCKLAVYFFVFIYK